jgi:diaminopimelate epimerase
MGAEIESHPHFPNRTNVSFVLPVDRTRIDVRFWERGAGETMSSGTGSTGAAVAAVARGMAQSPLRVLTPAGPLDSASRKTSILRGPASAGGERAFSLSRVRIAVGCPKLFWPITRPLRS